MKLPVLFVLSGGLLCLASPTARAQTLEVPRLEVGAQAGLLGAFADGIHFLPPTVGPRLTINVSQRHALELGVDTLLPSSFRAAYGFYLLQYKNTPRRPPDWSGLTFFSTVGTGGYYSYSKSRESRSTRPDGSVVVYPAHSNGKVSRLNLLTVGGGLERGLNRHAAVRLEGSGVFVMEGFLGFRLLAGVSVPIGGYRATPIK